MSPDGIHGDHQCPVPSCRYDCGAPPPGIWRISSARPAQTNSIASVTTMSGTRESTISVPVNAPAAADPTRRSKPKRSAFRKLMSIMYFADSTLMRLISDPTERSIPPEMITTDCAIAAKASGRASIASDWTSKDPQFAGIVCQ